MIRTLGRRLYLLYAYKIRSSGAVKRNASWSPRLEGFLQAPANVGLPILGRPNPNVFVVNDMRSTD